jgi:hypothetical protein
MLYLVDEAQLVRIYRLVAAGVEIARFERHLVHEMRQQSRLLQRRHLDEMADFGIEVHWRGSSAQRRGMARPGGGRRARADERRSAVTWVTKKMLVPRSAS